MNLDNITLLFINEMKPVLKSKNPKRLMGLKVHQDGFKRASSLECWSFGSLCEIEVDVQLKEDMKLS